jgi:hypothetical protein
MTKALNRNFIYFGVPLFLLVILAILTQSPFAENSTISLALTIDLLLIVPLVYYLLIRKTEIPKTTVVPMMIIGLLIGSYFLPEENQIYLTLFKTWGLPIIEVSVLTFVIIKVRSIIRGYNNSKGKSPDFFTTLKSTCYGILPKKVVIPFATEIAIIYYGFIDWKPFKLQENEFTYHKNSGTPALLGAFILVVGIETIALHFLLASWNLVIAWGLTILSIYTAIQLLGIAKSLSKRPISINKNSLSLKYGILNEVEIPFTDIEKIELSQKSLEKDLLTKNLSPLGELESHNIIIHLNKENELIGLYGIKKKFRVIKLHIDEQNNFKENIENVLKQGL